MTLENRLITVSVVKKFLIRAQIDSHYSPSQLQLKGVRCQHSNEMEVIKLHLYVWYRSWNKKRYKKVHTLSAYMYNNHHWNINVQQQSKCTKLFIGYY